MSDYSEDSKPPPKRRITLNDVVEFVGQNDPTFHTGILEVSAQVTKHINVFNETITQNARIFEQLAKPAWLDAAESLQQRINQTIEQIARPAWVDVVQSIQKSIEQQRTDFAKIFEVDISFARSQSAELIAQRFTSPSAATDRVIAAHRKTAQMALKIAIGAIPSNPRKQKTIALPPQDTHPFMKSAYDEIVEFIGDEDMKNQFVAKIGHFDIDLNFWGNNKIKLYVKNRLIAYLAVNYIKKTSQMHFYEPTNAEDATAYLEGFQVIHRLQIHLYSTIGTAPPPARDHNLLWTPEPLPPTSPQPQPTQPESVKPPDDATLPIKPDDTRHLNGLSQQEKQDIYSRVESMKFTGNEKKIMQIHLFNELTNSKIAERVSVTEGFVKNTLSKLYKSFPETRKKPSQK